MLNITNLNHSFEDRIIFSNAKLNIDDGEIIWLRGENGSGKTTLFRILSGILEPSVQETLEIKFNNKQLQLTELKKKVNYIPNKPYLFDYLSGMDNIKYLVSLFSLEKQYYKIMENMEALNMSSELGLEVHAYSLGMKAKLYIGVMLERDSSLILIDEILNNIDAESIKIITEKLKFMLEQKKCSIIFSSHVQLMEKIENIKYINIVDERLVIL